ncbi:MAG: hypothetical protein EBS12_04635 [Flavobacteriia bacterium]|nr:hypothetical protein [Flavobacteriia bacterium]
MNVRFRTTKLNSNQIHKANSVREYSLNSSHFEGILDFLRLNYFTDTNSNTQLRLLILYLFSNI